MTTRVLDRSLALGVFALGVVVSYAYGRRGLMPLDQSIVFDGGWRLLSGQVPFRDFGTPTGLVPIAMQALTFALLGVDWSSYLLHAAVVNGAFGAVVYTLLRVVRVDPILSGAGAAGSVWLLYPPIGVPFAEQHAFFFVAAAVTAAIWLSRREQERADTAPQPLGWLAIGIITWLAVASKPNTALAGGLPIAVALLWPGANAVGVGLVRRAGWVVLGLAVAAGATALLLGFAGAEPGLVRLHALDLPLSAGQGRAARFSLPRVAGRLGELPLLAPSATLLALAATAALLASTRRASAIAAVGPAAGLSLAWLAAIVVFVGTTVNQAEVGVAPAFVAFVLAGHALAVALSARPGGGVASRVVFATVLVVVVLDVVRFDRTVVAPRRALDMDFDASTARAVRAPGLEALHYQGPRREPGSAAALEELLAFLAATPGDFLLVGDHSILYGLSGRPSLAPSLWFHSGLVYPAPGTPAFDAYRERLRARVLGDPAVRWLVTEGDRTWMGARLSDFPVIAARAGPPVRTFGRFAVRPLRKAKP